LTCFIADSITSRRNYESDPPRVHCDGGGWMPPGGKEAAGPAAPGGGWMPDGGSDAAGGGATGGGCTPAGGNTSGAGADAR
jgi:hypothetical protein